MWAVELSEADISDALGGNPCRCTVYKRSRLAVLEAAKKIREG
jgi:aerobic-type carbon monoxide dehydrogenase small subunit (CoxS/CutS family)